MRPGPIVTPGLIDTHAHIYEHVTGDFGLNADLVGVRGGVTTVVDQGGRLGPDLRRLPPVRRRSRRRSACWPSFPPIWRAGCSATHTSTCTGPTGINVAAIVKAADETGPGQGHQGPCRTWRFLPLGL